MVEIVELMSEALQVLLTNGKMFIFKMDFYLTFKELRCLKCEETGLDSWS